MMISTPRHKHYDNERVAMYREEAAPHVVQERVERQVNRVARLPSCRHLLPDLCVARSESNGDVEFLEIVARVVLLDFARSRRVLRVGLLRHDLVHDATTEYTCAHHVALRRGRHEAKHGELEGRGENDTYRKYLSNYHPYIQGLGDQRTPGRHSRGADVVPAMRCAYATMSRGSSTTAAKHTAENTHY